MIKDKIDRRFSCDNVGCTHSFNWNAEPEPGEDLPVTKLNAIVVIQHAHTGYLTSYCSPLCAIEALRANAHVRPTEPSVSLADAVEMNSIVKNSNATKKLMVS